jgi:hypothetical protein
LNPATFIVAAQAAQAAQAKSGPTANEKTDTENF